MTGQRTKLFLSCRAAALVIVLVIFAGIPAIASTVTNALYSGTIAITNTGTATTNNQIPLTLSTSQLITAGWLNATATDAAIQDGSRSDLAFMPGWSTNPWMIWNPAIGQNTTISNYLYTGNVTGGKYAYFPGDAGMTTPDAAIMEMGTSDFILTQSGYIDTSYAAGKHLFSKDAAISCSVTDDDEISVTAYGGHREKTAASGLYGLPAVIGFTRVGQQFSTAPAYAAFPNGIITSLSYKLRKYGSPTGTAYMRVRKISDDSIIGTIGTQDVAALGSGGEPAWYTYNASPVTVIDAGAGIRITIEYSGGDSSNYLEVAGGDVADSYEDICVYDGAWSTEPYDLAYKIDATFTLSTPLVSGEHDLIVDYAGSNLHIADGITTLVSSYFYSLDIPDNGNAWYFAQNGAFKYLLSQTIIIGPNTAQEIVWQYDDVFTDLSGHGNNATPSFRTTTTDADVTAALSSYIPASVSASPSAAVGSPWELIPYTPTDPGMFSELNMTFIGAGMITALASAWSFPLEILVIGYAYGLALIIGLIAYRVSMGKINKYQRDGTQLLRPGSLFIQAMVSGIIMVYFAIAGGGVIPYWSMIPFVIEAVAAIIIRQNGGQVVN